MKKYEKPQVTVNSFISENVIADSRVDIRHLHYFDLLHAGMV